MTIASVTPRTRSASRAKRRPTGTAAATPTMSPTSRGQPKVPTSLAVISVPIPPNANCANDSWPAYPVSTTIDSATIEKPRLAASAACRSAPKTVIVRRQKKTNSASTSLGLTVPVPTSAKRSTFGDTLAGHVVAGDGLRHAEGERAGQHPRERRQLAKQGRG